jgi:optic atrophy 3 protein
VHVIALVSVLSANEWGQNRIKVQAHEHDGFRRFAAKGGQAMHQLNMRLSVALLRNVEAEMKAKEKAETPTVKTKEETEKQIQREEAQKSSSGKSSGGKDGQQSSRQKSTSIWTRKFRPLSEAKAVDLFADVIGDAFVLLVAGGLIIYEYQRSSQKPDYNLERIKELNKELEELKRQEQERTDEEKRRESRILAMEEVLRSYRDPKTKQPLLPTPAPAT